jgi:hypothetical protein
MPCAIVDGVMHWDQRALARTRPAVGAVLLGVFLLATQFAPVAHLATHRDDHTHGPTGDHGRPQRSAARTDAVHDHPHDHDDHHHHEGASAAPEHPAADAAPGHGDAPAVPAGREPDHGQASAAHFCLALVQGPPPPYLPPPAEARARPADATLRARHAAPRPLPPARGPPQPA